MGSRLNARVRNTHVADSGRVVAAKRKQRTLDAVKRAMGEIEADIEKNGGIYPYAGGEISAAEVLRRAGVNGAILQKPRHRQWREAVNSWVKHIKLKAKQGAKVVRRSVTDKVTAAYDEASELRQALVEAELERVDAIAKYEKLAQEYNAILAENIMLKASISGCNVVKIEPRRSTASRQPPDISD